MAFPPPSPLFFSFFHLPQKWKKGYYCKLLRLAHSLILKGTLFRQENTEESGGTFYPSFYGAMNHQVKKAPERPSIGNKATDRPNGAN